MMKIKIFNCYDSYWKLEQAVNKWLEENKNIYYVDMKYDNEVIIIIYKEGFKMNLREEKAHQQLLEYQA